MDVFKNRLAKAILKHIHNIEFYGEILKFIIFCHFDTNPRFPPFLLYVRCKFGVTFVRRCFRDAEGSEAFRDQSVLRILKMTFRAMISLKGTL